MITVKYLASLSENLNKTEDSLNYRTGLSVADIWQALNPDTPIPANLVCAINFDYASLDAIVPDGSELAFFPPVTGG